MNKYKKAIEVIDTLLNLMCGEEREDGYKPTMEEMSKSMDLLKELANKADLKHEEMTASEMFEKLGYKKRAFDNCIFYEKGSIMPHVIQFNLEDKIFESYTKCGMANQIKSLTANELKAVQQQMNELGWI